MGILYKNIDSILLRIPYAVKRILQIVPVITGIIILAFLLIQIAPGDPIVMFLGEGGADPQYVAQLKQRFGLDKPLYEQLFIYLFRVVQGDLGTSIHQGDTVFKIIMTRLSATVILMSCSILFATLMGIILGVYASKKPFSMRDNITIVVSLLLYSLPIFWLGQIMINIFSVKLGLLPSAGMISFVGANKNYWSDLAVHLILPTVALGSSLGAFVMRFVRTSMIEALGQDYILTARAKGLSANTVFYKHALRNALLPVVTYIGLRIGYMLSGSVVIEAVFGWPGIGRLLIEALFSRDYPLIIGILIFVSISVTIITFLVDIIYSYIDPRIKLK
jgi:peptide/nickel transport system permease protein